MSINHYDDEYKDTNKIIKKYLKSPNKKNWYKFDSQFEHQGKQGIAGILKIKHFVLRFLRN